MEAGVSKKVYKLLMAMYKDISCRVKLNGNFFKKIIFSIGVRQGCGLSPLLFNLFTDDIAELKKKKENQQQEWFAGHDSCTTNIMWPINNVD